MPRFRPAKAESGQSMSTLGIVGQNARTRPKVSHTLYVIPCMRLFALLRLMRHATA